MRRRHRRWLVVVGCALVVAVLAFGALVRGSHERARTQVLAEIGEPLTRPPRAIRPGVQSRPCRSGHRMATALAASEPLLDSERDLVVEFLAEPRPEAMEAVRAVVEPRAEALHSLLDAADCAGHGPVPRQPGDLLDLLDMGRLAAAHAALLALHGDAHGAMRWALDTWALSHQFGEGRLEELTVDQSGGFYNWDGTPVPW